MVWTVSWLVLMVFFHISQGRSRIDIDQVHPTNKEKGCLNQYNSEQMQNDHIPQTLKRIKPDTFEPDIRSVESAIL